MILNKHVTVSKCTTGTLRLAGLFVLCVGIHGQQKTQPLESYFGKAPVLDGVLSQGEWDDATVFSGAKEWFPAFHPVTDDKDLSVKGYVKHDAGWLYFGFDVTDDVLYGIDTERWLPDVNPKAHELSRDGYPWFGDEMEILLNATDNPPHGTFAGSPVDGNGHSWQMVCNLTKSRQGGVGVGGILEGEPRPNPDAWNTYSKWIQDGAQKCAAKVKPGGKGYILEWAIRFKPCVETGDGVFYTPAMGKTRMRIKIVLGDLDSKEVGSGNRFNFHHEQWYAPGDDSGAPRAWGYIWLMGQTPKPR